jgi:outer membrane receptor protein involved in Fe transport
MRATRQVKSAIAFGVSFLALSAGSALAQTAAPASGTNAKPIETIVVTAQKRAESVQDVPIAVSAFGQGTLDKLNIDGGPNLLYAIPNVTFSKGNFTGSNFAIRGIGSKAVGASADATVGVHQNGVPLTANLLFEAEFFDAERVEVLRGPQGTLYGRNATGGVINMIANKPRLGEWNGSAEITYGNYDTVKARGHVNVPLGENFAFRLAGSTTNRSGYGKNLTTMNDVDGRALYAFRASLGGEIGERLRVNLSYDYFNEDDNRLRVSKQLCKTDPGLASVGGVPLINPFLRNMTSQGCLPVSLESPDALGVLNTAPTLGGVLGNLIGLVPGNTAAGLRAPENVRDMFSAFDPIYQAEQKMWQGQIEFDLTDSMTLTYVGSFNETSVFSHEDYNKLPSGLPFNPIAVVAPDGFVNDPQLGRSRFLRTFDISSGYSEQTTHELRLQSDFDGRFNFTAGGIKIDFESEANYYVFSNALTAFAQLQNFLSTIPAGAIPGTATGPGVAIPIDPGRGAGTVPENVTNRGRNYFYSRTPYTLDAYALFGEAYFDVTETFRTTLGLRYTSDKKEVEPNFVALLANVGALPLSVTGGLPYFVDPNPALAEFDELTGKLNFDWKPDLGMTDDTLIYLTLARGYKGGGINPPPSFGVPSIKPTFEPEFINSVELGSKNTLADGAMQLNTAAFFYDYQGYQVSKIVNRSSLNENIDAQIWGIELESIWRPTDNLTFNAILGYLKSEIKSGESIDNLNRTQGNPNFTVVKNSNASNCIVPTAGVATMAAVIQGLVNVPGLTGNQSAFLGLCGGAFAGASPVPNGVGGFLTWTQVLGLPAGSLTPGEGFAVDLTGNEMPNSPEITLSLGGEYTWDMGTSWSGLARLDYYWQAKSFSRTFNTIADQLPSWSNISATVRLNHEDGFYAEFFVKNLTDEEVITDAYLTDDSSGLFTNVFYTEPRTFGVSLGKRW